MALLFPAAALATGQSSNPAPPPTKSIRAGDCTGAVTLGAAKDTTVRYIVWCGVEPGLVTFTVKRPHGPPPLHFQHHPKASGPGVRRPFLCRRSGATIACTGKTSGPITIRGALQFERGTPCSTGVKLKLRQRIWGGSFLGRPEGCPHSYHERAPHLGEIERIRQENGLDQDLHGNRRAIRRRARSLQHAWLQGDPVARWTAIPEAYGAPLRARDQRTMDFRNSYESQFLDVVEPWVAKHAASTYAGYDFDYETGTIYLGFTVDPNGTLEAFKRDIPLIAPGHVRPFPLPPTYTESELEHLMEEVPPVHSRLWRLVNSVSIDVLANKVEVGTEHVARVKRLLAEHYGPDAPFLVVFDQPAVAL